MSYSFEEVKQTVLTELDSGMWRNVLEEPKRFVLQHQSSQEVLATYTSREDLSKQMEDVCGEKGCLYHVQLARNEKIWREHYYFHMPYQNDLIRFKLSIDIDREGRIAFQPMEVYKRNEIGIYRKVTTENTFSMPKKAMQQLVEELPAYRLYIVTGLLDRKG